MKKSTIGITIGDPSGIGPEVVLKALSTNITQKANFIVIGDKRIISTNKAEILDLKNINPKTLVMGKPSAETGRASLDYIMEAFKLIKEKKIDAMVTAPICKFAIHKAGYSKFIGHTEMLAHLSKRKVGMMFTAGDLRVVLATIHIPLSRVCRMI
ncbi:MAG: 4-hydroxythreonine-4-phosphate dehydrogenase PdxA, partial [bacterium]